MLSLQLFDACHLLVARRSHDLRWGEDEGLILVRAGRYLQPVSFCISLYKFGRVVMTVTHSKFGSVRRQRVRWAESAQRIEMILEHLSAAAGCGALSYRLLRMTVVLHQHFLCYCNHSHAGGGDSVIVTSQRNRSCLQAHFLKRFSEDWAFQFKKWLVLKILCV